MSELLVPFQLFVPTFSLQSITAVATKAGCSHSAYQVGTALGAMISVLATWSVLYLILTGLGVGIRRSFGLRIHDIESWLTSFWIGWAFVIVILQLWHFRFSIDWEVFIFISTIATVGLLWNWRDISDLITKRVPQKWGFCLLVLVAAIWLANRGIDSPTNYDSGLYHLPSVRWAASYPIVPGLGHLHDRLAFNSSYFLYVAMLEIGPWVYKSHHLANGLLLLVLFTQIILSGFRLFRDRGKVRIYHLFHILLLTPLFQQLVGPNVSSPSPDVAIFCLGIVLFGQLLGLLINVKDAGEEAAYTVFLITTLAIVGMTVKLNFAVFAGAASLLALGVWFGRGGRHHRGVRKKTLAWVTVCMALIVIPWMVRGIVLSGYIAFPSTVGAFPVDWRISSDSVASTANYIRSWAMKPNVHWSEVLGNWDWFIPWAHRISRRNYDVVIPLVMTLLGLVGVYYHRTTKYESKMQGELWLILLVPISNLVFWFVTSPDPRYASVFFWLLGAGTMALAIGGIKEGKGSRVVYIVLCASVILSIFSIRNRDKFIGGGENSGFHTTVRADLKTFETRSGMIIYVPKKGYQCWDSPLPCTPYPDANLRLRKKGDMSRGFVKDLAERTGVASGIDPVR